MERHHSISGKRVILLGHSFGAVILKKHFEPWVEQQEPGWTDAHILALTGVGGPQMGAPKALSALMSGDARARCLPATAAACQRQRRCTHAAARPSGHCAGAGKA